MGQYIFIKDDKTKFSIFFNCLGIVLKNNMKTYSFNGDGT